MSRLYICLTILIFIFLGCSHANTKAIEVGQTFTGSKIELIPAIDKTMSLNFGSHAKMNTRHELDRDSNSIKVTGVFAKDGTEFSDLHLKYLLIGDESKILRIITVKKLAGIMQGDSFNFEHSFPYDSKFEYFSFWINADWY